MGRLETTGLNDDLLRPRAAADTAQTLAIDACLDNGTPPF